MSLTLNETRILQVPQSTIFSIVSDVDAYDQFLPWCLNSKVIEKYDNEMVADLTVGYKSFKETYRSQVKLDPYSEITVTSQPGPLKHLYTSWLFTSLSPNSTEVKFCIDFSLKSYFLQKALKPILRKSMTQIIAAFENRLIEKK